MVTFGTRRTLLVAALFVVSGCSGASSPFSSAPLNAGAMGPAQQAMSFVHRGVPFALPVARSYHSRAASPNYETRSSLVFEGDQSELAINIYQLKNVPINAAPIASIHVAAGCPYDMVGDQKGTLYVADNCGGNDVEEYPKGSTTESVAITNGISNPLGVAMDSSQTLYVSNYPASITEYPYGSTSPSVTITGQGLTDPFGLAVDGSGNLYIADFGALQVFEVKAGTTTVTPLNLSDLTEPLGVAIDLTNGNLWVTDGSGQKVNVYPPGSTTPSQTITGFSFPYAISVENTPRRRESVSISDINNKVIYVYHRGQYTPYATVNNGVALPTGLLMTRLQ